MKNRKVGSWIIIAIFILTIVVLLARWMQQNRKENPFGDETEQNLSADSDAQPQNTSAASSTESSSNNLSSSNSTDSFYISLLSDELIQKITGVSFPTEPQTNISYEDLSYVHVLHYDFNGEVQEGELICNQAIAQDLVDIFQVLYENQYPIKKIKLIEEYGGDDESSMEDNNTSCFNYRTIAGSSKLSNHSYGYAIDINPLYNPYVKEKSDGSTLVSPTTAEAFAVRDTAAPHCITTEDLCYQQFTAHGFTWGGDWNNPKDYQHFEKK